MPSSWHLLFACAIALACQTGCDNNNVASLQRRLTQNENVIRSLEAQNAQISRHCQRLESEIVELRAEQENLQAQNDELSQWAQKLAQRFGPSVWYFGEGEKPLPVKSYDQASPDILLTDLNRMLDKSKLPHVYLIKIEENVAYVRIDQESQLTQTMGTTGATGYIQAVTYTLSSLPGIHYVDFDFDAGDHAIPGRYSR